MSDSNEEPPAKQPRLLLSDAPTGQQSDHSRWLGPETWSDEGSARWARGLHLSIARECLASEPSPALDTTLRDLIFTRPNGEQEYAWRMLLELATTSAVCVEDTIAGMMKVSGDNIGEVMLTLIDNLDYNEANECLVELQRYLIGAGAPPLPPTTVDDSIVGAMDGVEDTDVFVRRFQFATQPDTQRELVRRLHAFGDEELSDEEQTQMVRWHAAQMFHRLEHRDADKLRAYVDAVDAVLVPEHALAAKARLQELVDDYENTCRQSEQIYAERHREALARLEKVTREADELRAILSV